MMLQRKNARLEWAKYKWNGVKLMGSKCFQGWEFRNVHGPEDRFCLDYNRAQLLPVKLKKVIRRGVSLEFYTMILYR